MWKIFAIVTLMGGFTGTEKDIPAQFISQLSYPTEEACAAALPEARRYWKSRVEVVNLKGLKRDGKIINSKVKIEKIYCSTQKIIHH